MSKRVSELFLFDIFVAILKIEKVSDEFKNGDDLQSNFVSWDSIIREFEIIGEAANNLIKNEILDNKSQVIVDFRNLLIHNYFGIDPEEVWSVIHDNLNDFKVVIINHINKIDMDIKEELRNSFIEENKHLEFIIEELKIL